MSGTGDDGDIPQTSLVKAGADVQALNWPFLCGLVATLLGDHSLWKKSDVPEFHSYLVPPTLSTV